MTRKKEWKKKDEQKHVNGSENKEGLLVTDDNIGIDDKKKHQ